MALIQTINVSTPNDGLGDALRDSQIKANSNFAELNSKKVEVIPGKGLSENDFTDADKAKLDGIDAGAEANVQADWNQADSDADDFIKNKPNIGPDQVFDQIVTIAATQTFTLPVGSIALRVFLNGALQYKITANNGSLTNRWSQSGDIVTLTKATAVNNYVYIEYK